MIIIIGLVILVAAVVAGVLSSRSWLTAAVWRRDSFEPAACVVAAAGGAARAGQQQAEPEHGDRPEHDAVEEQRAGGAAGASRSPIVHPKLPAIMAALRVILPMAGFDPHAHLNRPSRSGDLAHEMEAGSRAGCHARAAGRHGLCLRISRMPGVLVPAVAQGDTADERDILAGPPIWRRTTNFW